MRFRTGRPTGRIFFAWLILVVAVLAGADGSGDYEQDLDRGCSVSGRRHTGARDLADLVAGIHARRAATRLRPVR